MIRFSGCIEMLFRDLPFLDRFAAAAKAGLTAVEFWGWAGKDLPAIAAAAKDNGLDIAGCCIGTADEKRQAQWKEFGLLDERNVPLFVDMVRESLEATRMLNCKTYIVTVGQALATPREEQHAAIVSGFRAAARVAQDAGITLVLEPLNILVNHKGYYLDRSGEGFEILREVDSPNVKLLYDVYHQQITEGNLIPTIRESVDLIGHIHVADHPGRNEPGTGEINYRNVFAAIGQSGYQRYVGLEYMPIAPCEQTLARVFDLARG